MSTKITNTELMNRAAFVAELIFKEHSATNLNVYAIPRGGIPATYLVINAVNAIHQGRKLLRIVDTPGEADIFVDDMVDSGKTFRRYKKNHPNKPFYALFDKHNKADKDKGWLIFPWEDTDDNASAQDVPTRLLQYIGEEVDRGGLQETPQRFLKAWDHWTSGYGKDIGKLLKTFKDGAEKCDEMVLVRNIPAYSKCEHHLADIFGVAHVAYIPDGRILGLSKINRLVDAFGRRLQVQERWTNQIADALEEHLNPKGIAVVIEARHMCMESRGVCQQGHSTVTSAMRGVFRESTAARAEFMGMIR